MGALDAGRRRVFTGRRREFRDGAVNLGMAPRRVLTRRSRRVFAGRSRVFTGRRRVFTAQHKARVERCPHSWHAAVRSTHLRAHASRHNRHATVRPLDHRHGHGVLVLSVPPRGKRHARGGVGIGVGIAQS
eukprot:scaffold25025_cov129-Isochrysis_galbana.AAC.2